MNAIYLDRILPSLDESKFYIERIIKRRGRDIYFHRKGMDLNSLQFFYFDLFLILFVLFLVVKAWTYHG